jgi:twitching motility protein PilJ
MNSTKPDRDYFTENLTSSSVLKSNKSVSGIQQFVRSNLVGTITVTIAGSLLLTGTSSWNIWNIYRNFSSTVTKQFEIQKDSGQMIFMDEALTMSARMLVNTGDLMWEQRYKDFNDKYTVVLERFLANVPAQMQQEAKKTDGASAKLFEIEGEAFKLVKQGKKTEAAALLLGNEYTTQKKIYAEGNGEVLAKVDALISKQLKDYEQQLFTSIAFAGVTLPILLASWVLVLSAVKDYIRDRQAAQTALQASEQNLLALNDNLQTEADIRKQQEQQIRRESEQLQQDIGELLDVVCTIEEGDLTVQAQVNDRATGLIGDTLNRLVEELGGTLVQVSNTAQRVSANSDRQKKMAAIVAEETTKQAQSVMQVLSLTETVRESAKNAAQQLAATNDSLLTLQTAVGNGQTNIESLNQEIEILQEGSDRIVQQMKTLGEFVGLADRFVQDQTEIATQTQVLALNASLVAARAAEQRDPQQFVLVAREFESISAQVSQLAQQTNEGLTNLEQQSSQIHRVVSDVDVQVQKLGGLVNSFTQGVKQTREVFQTVQSVTVNAVDAGETVAATSKTIVGAADATARSVDEIATISQKIAQQSQAAQSVADRVNSFSVELLDKIKVFKLPAVNTANSIEPNFEPTIKEIPAPVLVDDAETLSTLASKN